MDTPPNSVFLPKPDQDITEKVGNVVIWNNGSAANVEILVVPDGASYFILDGATRTEPLSLKPCEILRVSVAATDVGAGGIYALAIEAAARFSGLDSFGFVRNDTEEAGRFLSDTG